MAKKANEAKRNAKKVTNVAKKEKVENMAKQVDFKKHNFDVVSLIADKIIDRIETEKAVPWAKPWVMNRGAVNRKGEPYSFLNQLLLPAGEYVTFKQCTAEGGKVKKGAKAHIVTFWKMWIPKDAEEDENGEKKGFPVLRYYKVFNVKDTTLEPKHFTNDAPKYPAVAKAKKRADAVFNEYIAREGVTFERHEQDKAFYRPADDLISLPLKKQFISTEEYYGTLFHEAVHSTGHVSRLNRLGDVAVFTSKTAYSREELVAEIGASAILGYLGLDNEKTFRNSTAYVKGWCKYLKDNPKEIISAAGKAQKAFDFIISEADEPEEPKAPAKQAKAKTAKAKTAKAKKPAKKRAKH